MRRIFSDLRTIALLVLATSVVSLHSRAGAESTDQLTEPIHRVALEESAEETPQVASRIALASV